MCYPFKGILDHIHKFLNQGGGLIEFVWENGVVLRGNMSLAIMSSTISFYNPSYVYLTSHSETNTIMRCNPWNPTSKRPKSHQPTHSCLDKKDHTCTTHQKPYDRETHTAQQPPQKQSSWIPHDYQKRMQETLY